MRTLFANIEPYKTHRLQVSKLHNIYFEESGNPNGIPLLFLHGGPGGGTIPAHRCVYDPKIFRIILVDQRGSGLSTPFAELEDNNTWNLIEDLEKIRKALGIDAWMVHGGSWGTTLALAYAITHPSVIQSMILRGIFLCRRKELLWFYQEGASWLFPDIWRDYEEFIPKEERHDYISAYFKRLTSRDEKIQLEAALRWSTWEAATSKLIPDADFISGYKDPKKALPFARIEAHYFINGAFFPTDNFILENAKKIKHIPTRIVHGRYDVVCPIQSAFDLHKALPDSQLAVIPDAGHSLFEPGILSEVIKACEGLSLVH